MRRTVFFIAVLLGTVFFLGCATTQPDRPVESEETADITVDLIPFSSEEKTVMHSSTSHISSVEEPIEHIKEIPSEPILKIIDADYAKVPLVRTSQHMADSGKPIRMDNEISAAPVQSALTYADLNNNSVIITADIIVYVAIMMVSLVIMIKKRKQLVEGIGSFVPAGNKSNQKKELPLTDKKQPINTITAVTHEYPVFTETYKKMSEEEPPQVHEPFMPAEQPLDMPVQQLDTWDSKKVRKPLSAASKKSPWKIRISVLGAALCLTAYGSWQMYQVISTVRATPLQWVLLVVVAQ